MAFSLQAEENSTRKSWRLKELGEQGGCSEGREEEEQIGERGKVGTCGPCNLGERVWISFQVCGNSFYLLCMQEAL